MMFKFFIVLALIFPLIAVAEEGESESDETTEWLIQMMVTAKATGMCGLFSQMSRFQQTTQIPGGDEFMARFLRTEAARLGYSIEEFTETCVILFKKHKANMEFLGAD